MTRASGPLRILREGSGDLQEHGDARGVVVGAGIGLAVLAAEVVEVGRDDDPLVLQHRVGPFELRPHVAAEDVVRDVGGDVLGERPVEEGLQAEAVEGFGDARPGLERVGPAPAGQLGRGESLDVGLEAVERRQGAGSAPARQIRAGMTSKARETRTSPGEMADRRATRPAAGERYSSMFGRLVPTRRWIVSRASLFKALLVLGASPASAVGAHRPRPRTGRTTCTGLTSRPRTPANGSVYQPLYDKWYLYPREQRIVPQIQGPYYRNFYGGQRILGHRHPHGYFHDWNKKKFYEGNHFTLDVF